MDILLPLIVGGLFGAALVLGGLADPDKIVGTLRLKDFHAMRTIAVFVLVGMAGCYVLDYLELSNHSIKPAAIYSVLIGGAFLGIGFGITGFCPGTGLACGASGRIDAIVSAVGMLCGALVYIVLHSKVAAPLDKLANYGKVTLPEITGISKLIFVAVFVGSGALALFLTRPKSKSEKERAEN